MDAPDDLPLVPDIEDMIPLPKDAADALPPLSPADEIEMRARTIKLISDLSGSPIVPTAEEQDMARELAREMVTDPKKKVEYAKYPNEVIAFLAGMVRETNHALVDDLADYKTFVVTSLVKEYAKAEDPKVRLQALTKLGEIDGVDAFKKRSEVTHIIKPIEEVEKELLSVLEGIEYRVIEEKIVQLTQQNLQKLKAALPLMPDKEKRRVAELLKQYQQQLTQAKGKDSFLDFINHVYPGYKVGPHHRRLAKIFEDIAEGKKKRVIVNIAPRHGKSEMISYLAPAWFLGKYPQKKVIMASHTADLAVNFGRRVRNLVGSDLYRDIFSNVELQADSKSASRWGTNFNGEYFAIGVGGALAGRGADLFIIDDPHSEQEAKQGRADVFEPAWEWFQSGPVQRLMPGGAIIVVMTRWSKMDLTGKIIDHMTRNEEADQWEIVEFPAILNDKPLWPDFWGIDELLAKKASMDVRYWQAQYMQQPTSEEGALIKREWWHVWGAENPPPCEHIIMSLDAAQEKTNRSDYNALTTWGVFFNEETNNYNIILLNAIKKRMEFPELKAMVLEEYKEWNPDTFIVEKKSNGAALYQEFRRMGVPISEFTPGKGQDKISRVNAVVDLFSSGIVWCTEHRWAQEVVEECNDFPAGTHDDLVDSTTLALMRFRQGGFIRLPTDEPEPTTWFKSHRREGYY